MEDEKIKDKGNLFGMDIFIEQLVKKKLKGIDYVKMFSIVFCSILLFLIGGYLLIGFLGPMGMSLTFFLLVGLIFLDWWLITRMKIEFEYSVTNGDITIDQITARRSRKRMISFSAKDVEVFKKYQPDQYVNRTFDKELFVDSNNEADEYWCMELVHKSLGRTLVIFTPSEYILKAIKPFLRKQVSFEAFGRK